jgi:hypothetical protein
MEPSHRVGLNTDDGCRDGDRDLVVGDQKRQGVEDPAEERAAAGDRAADERIAPSGQIAGVRQPFGDAMLTPAPNAVASPVKNAVTGSCVASTTAKMGASVESEPSIRPLNAGWTRWSMKL